MRMSNSSGGGKAFAQHDQRASIDDIRRSAAAILQQMTKPAGATSTAAGTNKDAAPALAFGPSSATVREAPKTTVAATTNAAAPDKIMATKGSEDKGDESEGDPFLSAEDRQILQEACEIAEISVDSPELSEDVHANEGLRRAFLLPKTAGGIGFSENETQVFLQRVAADRAALLHLGQEALDAKAKYASDEADATRAVAEAEAETKNAEVGGGDEELLSLLRLVKRTKEEAMKKAKEEQAKKEALERAAQAAIRRLGVCSMGYAWCRIEKGWRCMGGTHYLSDGAVASEMARGNSS